MLYRVSAAAAPRARSRCITPSPRLARGYRGAAREVKIPTGVAVFPREIVPPVRRWMESDFTDIRHWSKMSKGGHFAAFEQPEPFVGDVRTYFRTLR